MKSVNATKQERRAEENGKGAAPDHVDMPAPTPWPFVMAAGFALVALGLVTSVEMGMLGGFVALAAAAGWWGDVLPHPQHEVVAVRADIPAVVTRRHGVARISLPIDLARVPLPLEVYPVSAGIRGGLAGGAVMAVLATAYGIIAHGSLWYAVNLLALGFFPAAAPSEILAFHPGVFAIACAIHALTSLTVGLLYGAMLPMVPRRPILLGGIVAPLMWSGLIYGTLGIINPAMEEHIAWPWFVLTQVGYGVVAGVIVSHTRRIPTWHQLPLAIRAGLDAPGVHDGASE